MNAQIFAELGNNGALAVTSALLIAAAFTMWWAFYVRGRKAEPDRLSDGAVLMLSDGMVQQASSGAETLLGTCTNQPVVRVLDTFLGPDAAQARDAVNRLEMTGDPVDMLVHSNDGKPYELIGTPSGAMIRLVLRDARLLDDKLRDAQEKLTAADTALNVHDWAQQTLTGLIEEAPIIAWQRTASGEINWSGGEIRTRSSAVTAEQAVDLIVARTKLNRNPVLAGQPQKSRIEIVVNEGAETVSMHVIEMVRQDGTRIGFATDAGTAASAERTLTRFVQTMTETFAHLTVGLAIFDRNQTLALFNPALVQMWQVEPAWLARRPSLRDIIDELRATRRLPELQDFHKWRTRLIDLFENTEAADYEELWHLADGSNIRVLARPHPHGSLAFIFDDVTERMRLEQRYRHSIDLRRATLDRLNEGIAVFGPNGLLQFVNQAFHEIWGTDSETVYAAMHARQLVTLCEEMTVEAEVWHRLHTYITGEENRRAWTARLTMGRTRKLTARFAPLPDGSTMAVFSDITDSEEVNLALADRSEALAIADATRATVFDQVSDNLRAPLAEMLSTAQNLQTAAPGAEQANTSIQAMVAAAEKALQTISVLEDLTNVPIGAASADSEQCDLAGIMRLAVGVLSRRAAEAGVTLTVDDLNASAPIQCDPARLSQIAFNLVTHAIEACAAGEAITLSAVSEGGVRYELCADWAPGDHGVPAGSSDAPSGVVLLERLVDAGGGAFEIQDRLEGRLQAVCRFGDTTIPEHTPEEPEAFDGNVHQLTPQARR